IRSAQDVRFPESQAGAEALVGGDEAQVAILEKDVLLQVLDQDPILRLAGPQRFQSALLFVDVDDGPFENGPAVRRAEQADVLEDPERRAVFLAQANLEIRKYGVVAQLGEQLMPIGRLHVKFRGAMRQDVRGRVVAEYAGEGLVAIEQLPAEART